MSPATAPASAYDVLLDIYDEEFGFRLTNFSIKPVHVANGLARALTQRSYETTPVATTLRRYVRNQKLGIDEEKNKNKDVLNAYEVAFEPLSGTEPDPQKLSRLRSLALDVLGADGAVFPRADQSSYTLSNERLITRDLSDVRAGLFLARLLTGPPVDRAEAAEYFQELLKAEGDSWTTLALPLLALSEVREEKLEGEAAARAAKSEHLFAAAGGEFKSPSLRTLRDSFDRLGRFEKGSGSKLNSLRRLVLFGCFALHVQVVTRWSEREPGAPRPPILLDVLDGTVPSVRDASRASLRSASDAIEGLILDRFREYAKSVYGATEKKIRTSLGMGDADSLGETFENYVGGGMSPADAIAQALVDAAFDESREHPIGALIELGRRAGFLTPWAPSPGGKLQKRYTATAEFLEILIAATVEPDEPLEFPEFLDRLRDDFGIVVGRPEDDPLIRENNLLGGQFGPPTAISEEDLRQNTTELRQLLVETGYAKSYADGRTVVTTRPEGQL